VGKYSRDSIRPIIVSFVYFKDVEYILEKAYKLQGTTYGINRDYPKEILNARSRLWSQFKDAKKNKSNKVSIAYPAKLIINRQVIRDEFPDWNDVLHPTKTTRTSSGNTTSDKASSASKTGVDSVNNTGGNTQGSGGVFRSRNIYEVLSDQSGESSASDTETESQSDMVIEESQSGEETDNMDAYSQVMNVLENQTAQNNVSVVIDEPVDLCTQNSSHAPPIVVHRGTPNTRDNTRDNETETGITGKPGSHAPPNLNTDPPSWDYE